mgnify:CR=1 FL=1
MKFAEKLSQKVEFTNFVKQNKATCIRYYDAGHFLYLRQVRLRDG